jgi:hypothetical protein
MTILLRPLCNLHHRYHTHLMARNVIELCDELRFRPLTLIDCGAHNSEFARPLAQRWPGLSVFSIEPNPKTKPIGKVFRQALDLTEGEVGFKFCGPRSHLDVSGKTVPTITLDALNLPTDDAILKVDCENMTEAVVLGAMKTAANCRMVIVEVWNDHRLTRNYCDQSSVIPVLSSQFGSNRIVDASSMFGRIWTYDIAFWNQ